MSDFIAKDVSIKLKRDLGIFQGKIVRAEQNSITITNAFHNGMKMKKFTAEVTIEKDEIEELKFVKVADPTEVARSVQNTPSASSNSTKNLMVLPKSDNNHMSSKSLPNFTNKSPFIKPVKPVDNRQKTTKPITILKRPTASTSNNALSSSSSGPQPLIKQDNNGSVKKNKKRTARNYDLMQPDDFSEEDFDFEGNLALFDKKEIFKKIDNENDICTKPDLVRQIKTEGKFRHDENVLDSMLMQFRNVQLEFKPKQEYTTDEPGIIIPSIPQSLRNRIQNLACDHGHLIERQNDFLARGATELALNLLGGSRRLSPKNLHQWPRVTVICDEPYNMRQSEIGLSVARQLASHGLKVMVYVKTSSHSDKPSKELELFTATGNDFTGNIRDLTNSDLVIMSVTNMNQNSQIIRYIQNNRAPVMAIDPPATGISEISIRNAVLPILPLDDIHNTCGKLHLVNICISEKFFKDAGIKYSPIFGSKFIIPLHLKN